MPTYTCDPHVELNGHTARSFMINLRAEGMKPLLEKYGLANIDPEQWYPLRDVLAVLSELAGKGSSMFDFVSLGLAAAQVSPIPPEIEQLPLEQFLMMYEKIYPTRHRNGDAGTVRAEQLGERHVKMIFDVAYPDDLMYGLMYGFARRFLPPDTRFRVKYDEATLRREQGGKETVIHITWG